MLKTVVPKLLCCQVALVSFQCLLDFEILSLFRSFLPHFASPYVFFFFGPSAILLSPLSFQTYPNISMFLIFILHVTFYIAAVINGTFPPLLQFSLYCLSTVFSFCSSLKLSVWKSSTHFIAHSLWSGSVRGMATVNQVLSIEKGSEETKQPATQIYLIAEFCDCKQWIETDCSFFI